MVKIRKKSHRQPTRLRAKIEKKVREHRRKQKKEAKNRPAFTKKRKDPGIPSSLPFKEKILREAETQRQLKEEERERQKERRKKDRQKLVDKKRSLDGLVKDATQRGNEFDRKQQNQKDSSDVLKGRHVENSLKTFYKEFRKVVEAADVILEVLDARDPLGSRCQQMEETVIGAGTNKRLVLVLNKIDLVPKENVEAWLKYLKNEYPVVAFKASTQLQSDHLSRNKIKFQQANEDLIKMSNCLGAEDLMKLLGNYCRNKDIKTVIRVGVVGLPNTGKSSIINSLKRSKACNVGSTPGITRQMQEVQLDKHIRLLDSPGVVMATGNSDTSTILRNCVRLEGLQDASIPVEAILKRCNKQQMMIHYCITDYKDVQEFLSKLAIRMGRLKKGGVPDSNKAARVVLQHWNMGKIKYYTHPPEQTSTHVASEFVTQMGKEFDIDCLLAEQQKTIQSLQETSSTHMLVESMGPADVVMKADDIDKVLASKAHEEEEQSEEDEMDEEDEEDEEQKDMEDSEDDEMQQMTVSLAPSKAKSSAKSSKSTSGISTPASEKSTGKSTKKSDVLNVGLPQSNKDRKMDFKKMKKQRKRRDKVAGELADALTAAFDMGSSVEKGDESYQFDNHF